MLSKLLLLILPILFVILGFLNPTQHLLDRLTAVLLAGMVILGFFLKKGQFTKIILATIIVIFILDSLVISGELRRMLSSRIDLFTYNNDPGVLYKTYSLTKEGMDYYDAYRTAQLGRFNQPILPGDIWGWRLPTLFYIWQILPGANGIQIYILWLIIASSLLWVAYDLARRFLPVNLSLLSPYLLFPYLHFASRDQMLLETEWWSVGLFIIGIYFVLYRKKFLATIFLSLTLLIREVYVLPIGLMFLFALIKAKHLALVFLIPLISFTMLFTYHIFRVSQYIDVVQTLLRPRSLSLPNGIFFLQQTLSFGSWEYLLFKFRPFVFLLTSAVLGCISLARNRMIDGTILLLAFLPFPLAFLRFGTVPYNDYWGIIYVPIVLILAPLILMKTTLSPHVGDTFVKK